MNPKRYKRCPKTPNMDISWPVSWSRRIHEEVAWKTKEHDLTSGCHSQAVVGTMVHGISHRLSMVNLARHIS